VHPRRYASISERNVSFGNLYVIWLTRGAGRYKYLNSELVACKNITDRQV